jgi:hypothetical protein
MAATATMEHLKQPPADLVRKPPSLLAILYCVRSGYFRSACAQRRNNYKAPCSKPEKSSADWLSGRSGRVVFVLIRFKILAKTSVAQPHVAFLAAKKWRSEHDQPSGSAGDRRNHQSVESQVRPRVL